MEARKRKRAFAPRETRNDVPVGWTHVDPPPHVSPNDRHSWYRCPEIQFALSPSGMELRRCVHVCRKDQISKHPNAQFPHKFTMRQCDDPGFPTKAQDSHRIRTLQQLRSTILDHTALFIYQSGLCLNKASNMYLIDFISSMIQVGKSLTSQNFAVEEAIGCFSRGVLREKLVELGEKLREKDLIVATEVRFVNLAIDAGTVLGKGVVHCVLTNPYDINFPILLEIHDNESYDKFKYKQLFGLLIAKCLQHNLILCSIITDGLRAQKSALREFIDESDDQQVKTIIPLHCLAHVTQLVFTDTLKQSAHAKHVITEISDLAVALRKSRVVQELGETCPSTCPTRWLYVIDILQWLFRREDKLNAFLMASENNPTTKCQLPDEWKRFLLVFLPLKRLNLCFESSDCGLWEVIPLLQSAMSAWKKITVLLDEAEQDLLKLLLENLFRRLAAVAPDTVVAAFALSELGREQLRRREDGFQTRGCTHACFKTQRICSFEVLFDDPEADVLGVVDGCSLDEEVIENSELDDEARHYTNGDGLEVPMDDAEDTEDDGPELPSDLERLLNYDVYKFCFARALDEIVRVAALLGTSSQDVCSFLRTWIYEDREHTPTIHQIGMTPDAIWRRAPAHSEEWRPFAEIAIRFITIGTSEADCERMLSKQRDVQGIRTSNIQNDLLEARLRATRMQRKL